MCWFSRAKFPSLSDPGLSPKAFTPCNGNKANIFYILAPFTLSSIIMIKVLRRTHEDRREEKTLSIICSYFYDIKIYPSS